MALKVKVRPNLPSGAPSGPPGYQLRPRSFVGSGFLHFLILFALGLIPGYRAITASSQRPVLDELVRPQDHKIVWYSYRKELPDVRAAVRVGTFPVPRARELSKNTIIATAPNAKSTQQFIWRPVPKVEIHRDLPAPNLILRAATAIPAPAPPPPDPKPLPKADGAKANQANLSPPTPDADVNRAQDNPAPAIEVPKPRKAFVPPAPSKQPARLPMSVADNELPVPDASITGPPSTRMALPDGIGTAAMSKGAPPPSNAPPGPANNVGNAQTDIAIAGLHPSDKLNGPLPDGARPGQFSRAPVVGEPATGPVGTGLAVPDLTIREDHSKTADAPRVTQNRKAVLYADKLRGLPISTLSVPLRPASRTIPVAIDARFRGRNVYTMVVPIENFAPYSGDWILWFAERQTQAGDTPFVRAPVPLRKFESVEPVLPGAHTELRVQLAAVIARDGKIDNVVLLKSMSPVLEQAVRQDMAAWEFKPATRDGVAVDVDVVLEIPYSLPPQLAKSTP